MTHPRDILLGAQAAAGFLPVCDHYSGVEARMRKSLQLQAEMSEEFGTCVFDVTLDCEDGAPVGGESEHAALVVSLVSGAAADARVAVRVHALAHPAFEADIDAIAGQVGQRLSHLMVPKVESAADVDRVVAALAAVKCDALPIHVLLESPAAVHRAFDIAAHPRVQSLSFGLMDFVSSHGGAIPAGGMSSQGQFTHPLVVRAKLEIAPACHAHGKVPSHCVVTEFSDTAAMQAAARK
ncbi:MAG: aldolase/citrate lyase family protein, partial [Polaromonas sp.]|nr:aldolase/citrate lyase family protein [Polaromonas sp.]